jgi:hypothetical protein
MMGHMRSTASTVADHYTQRLYCNHSAVIDDDQWPDETALLDLDRRAVCAKCGMIGADVRPNWSERPRPESLTLAMQRRSGARSLYTPPNAPFRAATIRVPLSKSCQRKERKSRSLQ